MNIRSMILAAATIGALVGPAAAMAERGQFIREQADRIARAFLS